MNGMNKPCPDLVFDTHMPKNVMIQAKNVSFKKNKCF